MKSQPAGLVVITSGVLLRSSNAGVVALIGQEIDVAMERIRPVWLGAQDVGVKRACMGSLAFVFVQSSGPKQRLQVGAVAFPRGGNAGANGLQDGVALAADIGDRLVNALFGQDAGHLLEHAGGRSAPFNFGERGGKFIDVRKSRGVRHLDGVTQALTLLPVRGLIRIGKFTAVGFFNRYVQMGADFFGAKPGCLDQP